MLLYVCPRTALYVPPRTARYVSFLYVSSSCYTHTHTHTHKWMACATGIGQVTYMCPHTPSHICVLIVRYVCPCANIFVSTCCCICVLILLYVFSHFYVSSYSYICVLILLHMCPHTCPDSPIYVSSYFYTYTPRWIAGATGIGQSPSRIFEKWQTGVPRFCFF